MEIQKILVAFDGSKHSEKGLDIAISLVKDSKKSIVALFVKPHSVDSVRYGNVFSGHQDEIVRKTFQTLREKCERNNIKFSTEVRTGDVKTIIEELADDTHEY